MANKVSQIPMGTLPMTAGQAIFTKYNKFGVLDMAQRFVTSAGLVESMATTENRTTETVPNGNGADLQIPTDSTYSYTLNMTALVRDLHDFLSDKIVDENSENALMPVILESVLPIKNESAYEYTLSHTPVARGGNVVFDVVDNFGNRYEKAESSTALTAKQYYLDTATKKVSFAEQDKDTPVTITYYRTAVNARVSKANDVIKTSYFQVEILNREQTKDSGEVLNIYTLIEKTSITGGISEQAKQKSVSAPIAYEFTTAPIPSGKSPLVTTIETEENGKTAQ